MEHYRGLINQFDKDIHLSDNKITAWKCLVYFFLGLTFELTCQVCEG